MHECMQLSLCRAERLRTHQVRCTCKDTAGAAQGFKRVRDNLEDICLDNPGGEEQLQQISAQGVSQGWLESDWDEQTPRTRTSMSLGSPRSVQVLAGPDFAACIFLSLSLSLSLSLHFSQWSSSH